MHGWSRLGSSVFDKTSEIALNLWAKMAVNNLRPAQECRNLHDQRTIKEHKAKVCCKSNTQQCIYALLKLSTYCIIK